MKLPFIVNPPFRIIAHRGASAYAPENTLAAFQLAVDMGIQ
ncbi:MAG: glycerophosphodiester phosphodiesterase, partial [Methylosarcina sp.]